MVHFPPGRRAVSFCGSSLCPLHLIEDHLVRGAVVEFGGFGETRGEDDLGVFGNAAVLQVGGDAVGPEFVAA